MAETFEEAYEQLKRELMPKKECQTCECGEMQLGDDGWEYVCELEACYHALEETKIE